MSASCSQGETSTSFSPLCSVSVSTKWTQSFKQKEEFTINDVFDFGLSDLQNACKEITVSFLFWMDLVHILQVMSLVILSPYNSLYKGKEKWAKYFTQSDLSNHSQVSPSAVWPVVKQWHHNIPQTQRCSSEQKNMVNWLKKKVVFLLAVDLFRDLFICYHKNLK